MYEKSKVSFVIPVFNEEQSLSGLYSRLKAVIDQQGLSYEIIMVDDGSTDTSIFEIHKLNEKDHHVKLISFSRNFGHMIALSAGLDYASGDAVITLDADLQHPPEIIPKLIEKWQGGAEVVNTVRKEASSTGFIKKITAGFFYWLINKIARINLTANTADYRLLDRKVVATLKTLKERSRFIRGLVSWVGFKQAFIEYHADERVAGKTKYSFSKMVSFAIDGITSFSAVPLRLATYLGLIMSFFSFLYIVYAIYIRFFTSRAIAGWTSVMVAVLLIGSVQLVFLGIIGEYLSRVFDETKKRPLYIVSKKIGF